MKKKQKEITVEISSLDSPTTSYRNVDGWGENAKEVQIVGELTQIKVSRNGESQFSIRICEDGQLILTSYKGPYQTMVPQNLVLEPLQPWK
jgi:hypothetical protein